MFDNLTERLSRVLKTLRGEARLTEDNIKDALREVRMALLEADVALPVVRDFVAAVREKALGEDVIGSLTPGQAVIGVVYRELTALMGEHNDALNLATTPPAVVLMAGLQGSGKTTTSGKLAKWLKEQHKKKVLLVSCDVYRPAAIEQLKTLAGQVHADFFPSSPQDKPVEIAARALDYALDSKQPLILNSLAGIAGATRHEAPRHARMPALSHLRAPQQTRRFPRSEASWHRFCSRGRREKGEPCCTQSP